MILNQQKLLRQLFKSKSIEIIKKIITDKKKIFVFNDKKEIKKVF